MKSPTLALALAAALVLGGGAGWFLHRQAVPEDFVAIPGMAYVPGLTPWVYEEARPYWDIRQEDARNFGNAGNTGDALAAAEVPQPLLPPGASVDLAAIPPGIRVTTDLLPALEAGELTLEASGNGRDRLRLMMVNRSRKPLRLSLPAGQTFQGMPGKVVVPRALIFDFAPGESRLEEVATLALSSMNRVTGDALGAFVVAPEREERLDRLNDLFRLLAAHPEVPISVAQTAALALLENLPAGSLAKFSATEGAWDTTAFRVDTADLIAALALLRKLGIPDGQIAMTVDPQTRIEAMLDPLARVQAMHYYGIAPDQEWAYWKRELLEGNPRTRHYALHGIGRYFPEVALKMLPTWVRETRTSGVYRKTALLALTETERPEALEILTTLQRELADQPELGIAIAEATTYLEAALARKERESSRQIGFRITFDEFPPPPAQETGALSGELEQIVEILDEIEAEEAAGEADAEASGEPGEGSEVAHAKAITAEEAAPHR